MGANDLAALGEEFEAPPRVAAVEGPEGAQRVVLEEEPTTNNQRPRRNPDTGRVTNYEDLLGFYQKAYDALQPGQVLLTLSPIPRPSTGFVNYQLHLLERRVKRVGPRHHHVNLVKAFTAYRKHATKKRKREKARVEAAAAEGGAMAAIPALEFGGQRVARDTLFTADNVHLTDEGVQMVLEAIDIAIRDIEPDKRKEQEGEILLSNGSHFTYAF